MYPALTRRRHLIRALRRAVTGWATGHASGGDGSTPVARPLETSPSRVGYAIYADLAPGAPSADRSTATPDGAATGLPPELGFPTAPIASGTDRGGALFDTTEATVREDGLGIGYRLRLCGIERTYELAHVGGGTYRSRDCELTFEWTGDERFVHLDALLDRGETYHVEVHDVVQLYEPGGAFDWSVTRTDLSPAGGGRPLARLLTVVWDDDGPDNDRGVGRVDDAATADTAGAGTKLPTDGTPSVSGDTIEGTAAALMAGEAGHGR